MDYVSAYLRQLGASRAAAAPVEHSCYSLGILLIGAMVDAHFLVANILAVIGLLFYIIYWNRVLAVLLGLVFRIVLRGSTAWIRIGA
jgi:hypothetical protein